MSGLFLLGQSVMATPITVCRGGEVGEGMSLFGELTYATQVVSNTPWNQSRLESRKDDIRSQITLRNDFLSFIHHPQSPILTACTGRRSQLIGVGLLGGSLGLAINNDVSPPRLMASSGAP